jgi:hypothetical protein
MDETNPAISEDEEREFWEHLRDLEIEQSIEPLSESHPDYL